jgi:hypothetical protein
VSKATSVYGQVRSVPWIALCKNAHQARQEKARELIASSIGFMSDRKNRKLQKG